MTKDRNRPSAAEAMERMKADPAYRAKLEAQEKRAAKVQALEEELLRELATLGFPAVSLRALLEQYAPLPTPLSEALASRVVGIKEPVIQESVVRALGAARTPFDVQPLVRLFEVTNSDSLRWAIANTFAEVRPLLIRDWLLRALLDPRSGKAREMLALAVARTSSPSEANRALAGLLDEIPGHAAIALAESGGPQELVLLRAKAPKTKGWVKKEIEKAMRAISRRG